MEWRRTLRFSLIYFAISLVALFAFEWFLLGGGPGEAPYSEFLQALEQRNVAQAQVGDRTVVWTTRDQQQTFISTRIPAVDDSALLAQLRSSGAEFAGRFKTNWWGTLLSWLLPIVVIFGL